MKFFDKLFGRETELEQPLALIKAASIRMRETSHEVNQGTLALKEKEQKGNAPLGELMSDAHQVLTGQVKVLECAQGVIRAMPAEFNKLNPMAVQFADRFGAPDLARIDIIALSNWANEVGKSGAFRDLVRQLDELSRGIESERKRLLVIYRAADEFALPKEDNPSFYHRLKIFIEDRQTYVPYKYS